MQRTLKARYHRGRIELQEPLELDEGTEVIITAPATSMSVSPVKTPHDVDDIRESLPEPAERERVLEQQALLPPASDEPADAEASGQESTEEVEVDYSYITRAAQEAARLLTATLDEDDLQAVAETPTDFSFSLEIDEPEEP
jgi:hypothetical protein